MNDEDRLKHLLSTDGVKVLIQDCLPECRRDGTEGRLAPSTQISRLKLIGEVRTRISGYVSL